MEFKKISLSVPVSWRAFTLFVLSHTETVVLLSNQGPGGKRLVMSQPKLKSVAPKRHPPAQSPKEPRRSSVPPSGVTPEEQQRR